MSTRGASTGLSLPFPPLSLLSPFPSAPSLAPHSLLVSLRLIHTHARDGGDRCNSYINTDGSFPMGAVGWQVYDDALRRFQRRTLTMHAVVRAILAAHSSRGIPRIEALLAAASACWSDALVQEPLPNICNNHIVGCWVRCMYVCRASERRTLCGATQTRSREGA